MLLGGGLEYKAATSPWVLGVEYLFYHLNSGQNRGSPIAFLSPPVPLPNPACATANCIFYSWGDLTVQTVRARLSYKF
jgi:opacity protein-like surface antigen